MFADATHLVGGRNRYISLAERVPALLARRVAGHQPSRPQPAGRRWLFPNRQVSDPLGAIGVQNTLIAVRRVSGISPRALATAYQFICTRPVVGQRHIRRTGLRGL